METIVPVPIATSKPGYFLLNPIAPEMKTTQSKATLSDDAQGQHEGGTAGNRKQVKSTRRSFAANPNGGAEQGADAPDLLDKKPSAAAAGLPIALGGVLAGPSWLGSSLIVYFVYFMYFMYVFANVVARVERLARKLGAQSAVRVWCHHR